MPNLSTQLARDLTDHGIALLRLSAGLSRRLMPLLTQLEADIVRRLTSSRLSGSAVARLVLVLNDVRKLIDQQYAVMSRELAAQLGELARLEANAVARVVNGTIGADLLAGALPKPALAAISSRALVQGAILGDWFKRAGADLAFRFAVQVRTGMGLGETNEQIVKRIVGTRAQPGIMAAPRAAVRALVQTSVQTAANNARLAVFKRNADVLKGVQQISTLDSHTTDICIAYDHQAWDLDGNPLPGSKLPFNGGPPRHWNCRSVLIPLTKSWQELGVKGIKEMPAGTRASMDGQVSAKLSYEDWLRGKSEAQQDAVLGKGKAELWRAGKIGAAQLLDQGGRPLTLGQLQAKYG